MAENTIKDVKLKIGTESQFQSKLKDLPINTLVGTTDPIQEGELDTSIINKLNKAENALPKPTNDTTGSAGQVLKKTANGSEWGDVPSSGGGGEAVTPSGATASATSGTFTSAEWTKLQADKNNYIWFNNEIYRLSDTGHEGTEGIWSYVHTGWDGTAMRDKSINVTVSTGAWTLVQGESGAVTQLYQMLVRFDDYNHPRVFFCFPTTRNTITPDEVFSLEGHFTGYTQDNIQLYFLMGRIDNSLPRTPDNTKISAYKISDNSLYASFVKNNFDHFFVYEL